MLELFNMSINRNYIKTIKEFIYDSDESRIWKKIVARVALSRGEKPSKGNAEHRSWINSLGALGKQFKKLNTNVQENTYIVLEASFNNYRRIDVSLVGTKNGKIHMILIENKQWKNPNSFKPYAYDELECVANDENGNEVKGEIYEHPCSQVDYYRTNLYDFNEYVQNNKILIRTLVFLQNMYSKDFDENATKSNPFLNNRFEELVYHNPIFAQGDSSLDCKDDNQYYVNAKKVKLNDYINGFFDGGKKELVINIFNSTVRESNNRIARLSTFWEDGKFDEIRKTLDESQINIFNEVKNSVFHNLKENSQEEKKVYLVHGDPGTGKSLLALALYIYFNNQLNNKSDGIKKTPRVKFIVNSIDVMKTISLSFGITKDIFSYKFAPKKDEYYDLVICDESHRYEEKISPFDKRKTIDTIIQHSGVCIFFYDYYQSIALSDYLSSDLVNKTAKENGAKYQPYFLNKVYRLRNGYHYSIALQKLLNNNLISDDEIKRVKEEGYKAYIFKDVQEMFELIKEIDKIDSPVRSRMLAGRCRTIDKYGNYQNWEYNHVDKKTKKVDIKPTIAPIRNNPEPIYAWNKDSYGKYNCFSVDIASRSLIGSVEAVQGVSLRYAGVILGPDICYNSNKQYPIYTNIFMHDTEDPLIQIYNEAKKQNVIPTSKYYKTAIHKCILNAYRVLLTRAEEGCFIYCYNKSLEKCLIESKLFKYFDKEKFVMPKPVIMNIGTRIKGVIVAKDSKDNYLKSRECDIVDASGKRYKVRAIDYHIFKSRYGEPDYLNKTINVTFIKRTSKYKYDYAANILIDNSFK